MFLGILIRVLKVPPGRSRRIFKHRYPYYPFSQEKKIWWRTVPIAVGIILSAFTLVFVLFFLKPWQVRVPSVTGRAQTDAEMIIESAGLKTVVEKEYSDRPEGLVVDQDPPAGEKISRDSVEKLVVSKGEPVVPSVIGKIGKHKEKAIGMLRDRGLKLKIGSEVFSNQSKGTILSQAPMAGASIPINSKVVVEVSKGRPRVPKVIGATREKAEKTLKEKNFDPIFMEELSDEPPGTVLRVLPEQGTEANVGETIELKVSSSAVGLIQEPEQGASVGALITVQGVARDIPGRSWWLLVFSPGTGTWHPQNAEPITPAADKTWKVECYIGSASVHDIGQKFDIVLVLATPLANEIFSSYAQKAIQTGNWPGLPLLVGVEKVSQITVTRKF